MNEVAARSIDERLLPPQLRLIVRAIGAAKALTLLRRRGGTRLKLVDGPLLQKILGEDDAQRLVAAFPGLDEISLPKHDKITAQLRNQVIRAERNRKSLIEQALEHDLTDRQIKNIRRHDPAADLANPTLDLFEPAKRP